MPSSREWSLCNKDKVFLERLIFRLMNWNPPGISIGQKAVVGSFVNKLELIHLCRLAIKSFSQQKQSLPLTICADLHGHFFDLRRIMNACGLPPGHSWLFLGDYVDRAKFSVETFCLLLAFKVRYPDNGYGFFDECIEKYGDCDQHLAFLSFVNVFNHIPVIAIVGDRILAMHGGLSPELKNKSDFAKLLIPSFVPAKGLMCDLLWSDPDGEKAGWSTSNRSVSLWYDQSVVNEFCRDQRLDLIVRGHQVKREWRKRGYNIMAGGNLITLFSAPNYGGLSNTSAVLNVSKEMVCEFYLFRPRKT
uniref:Serine/threonine specific protein phosphatases domain-containing protein n=1 Tax=Ditylenchus dipsaci TaxID=166011 RepID=A0A915DL28_9BILA